MVVWSSDSSGSKMKHIYRQFYSFTLLFLECLRINISHQTRRFSAVDSVWKYCFESSQMLSSLIKDWEIVQLLPKWPRSDKSGMYFLWNRKQCIGGMNLINYKEFEVIYCLSNHWSVCMGCNETITPQELNTLWERPPSVVPRETNHETWSNSVRGTGKQPKLLSFIESTFS